MRDIGMRDFRREAYAEFLRLLTEATHKTGVEITIDCHEDRLMLTYADGDPVPARAHYKLDANGFDVDFVDPDREFWIWWMAGHIPKPLTPSWALEGPGAAQDASYAKETTNVD